jgi:hypothetical protein
MNEHFYFRSHLCIAMELLSINLYELIKANGFVGFTTSLIRRFTSQMLMSLQLMRHHRIVHCDLKPEVSVSWFEGSLYCLNYLRTSCYDTLRRALSRLLTSVVAASSMKRVSILKLLSQYYLTCLYASLHLYSKSLLPLT